jgi:hypothetical protein
MIGKSVRGVDPIAVAVAVAVARACDSLPTSPSLYNICHIPIQDSDLLYSFSQVQDSTPGKSTTLKYPVQVWQVSNLHDVALKQSFRRREVLPHRRKQDVLNLPAFRLDSTLILVQARRL